MSCTAACGYFGSLIIKFLPSQLMGILMFFPFVVLVLLVCVRFLHTANRELAIIHEQLGSFSMETASCFCCDNNHVDPSTGETIICDRKLIYAQLAQWMLESDHSSTASLMNNVNTYLPYFDVQIRTRLRSCLDSTAGVSYIHAVYSCTPFLWRLCDAFFRVYEVNADDAWHICLEYLAIFFVIGPLAVRSLFLVVAQLDRFPQSGLLIEIMAALLLVIIILFIWVPQYVASDSDSWLLHGGVTAVQVGLVFCAYLPVSSDDAASRISKLSLHLRPSPESLGEPCTVGVSAAEDTASCRDANEGVTLELDLDEFELASL
eukprot:TRINITY_DN45352_c0_g2_i1.p1 TRINITY_DN45352_c0_g2~~TRINITY_DN45352_c0_g2_i1.p1  ORF type:complete len:319 (+),score=20.59 TRINITY_DN45352_c0_g2_i1:199-1155(+)